MSVVLATAVGGAEGGRAAAMALACLASEPDRAALLVELTGTRSPRPSLVSTVGARRLEERLAAHLPEARVASRGRFCHLTLAPDADGLDRVPAALPLAREAAAILHLAPGLLRPALGEARIRADAALLRADLARDRSLTALVAADLIAAGLRVAVQKRPLPWLAARAALLGALPPGSPALPPRLRTRLLGDDG